MKSMMHGLVCCLLLAVPTFAADEFLVESEAFVDYGGWVLDTQFVDIMGSPYLMAHGLGQPVKDATTTVTLPAPGVYHVYVRTKDWVAHWKAPGAPGKFQLLINGKSLSETFGTRSESWFWHSGGTVEIKDTKVALALHDLTGFNGRCDAIYFTTDSSKAPPDQLGVMDPWRKKLLGVPADPVDSGPYDLVVIGGGYSGMGAAISAARQGIKVALVQDRPVLGGNGSSEVRVWSQGLIRRGRYPTIGEIVEEFEDAAKASPGTYEEFEDARKESLIRAEKNIALFLNYRAYGVDMDETKKRLHAVRAFDTRTGKVMRFTGRTFCDATGHGSVGALACADFAMEDKGRMGMSNMWRWQDTDKPAIFPQTPWALPLTMDDFPYPKRNRAEWFWESGFDKDPIIEAEYIRDWNLRAAFGAFNAMKNGQGAAEHAGAKLEWLAYVGGPRESRRLLGDILLTQDDIVNKKDFPDGCVPSTWTIDLHYPKKEFADKYSENPFISIAVHDKRVDRQYGYPVPYRCFYSRNIDNLFMAGRDISVTHEALGTVRVMKTCGMMGEVVGKAAMICAKYECTPREVYLKYWPEMEQLLQLPGRARRDTPTGPIRIEGQAPPPVKEGTISVAVASLKGIVIDDKQARKTGNWTGSSGLRPYVHDQYAYASPKSKATASFTFTVPTAGNYEVRFAFAPHANRASKAPITVRSADGEKKLTINEQKTAPIDELWISLGIYRFDPSKSGEVFVTTEGADGNVHIDAVQVLPAP